MEELYYSEIPTSELPFTVRAHEFKREELVSAGEIANYRRLMPDLEQTVVVGMMEFPPGSTVGFRFDKAFATLVPDIARGIDVARTLEGGASGAAIDKLKQDLRDQNIVFPTRVQEYERFLSELPTVPREKVVWFQVGGWPFNDGSMFYSPDQGIITSQDVAIAVRYTDSPLYGKESPFAGIGVSKKGCLTAVFTTLDTTSQEAFESSSRTALADYATFIGCAPTILRDGNFDLQSVFTSQKNGDLRHIVSLPYIGGLLHHDAYGIAPSGSVFLPEMLDLHRSGRGGEICDSIVTGQPLHIPLTEESQSHRLIKTVLDEQNEKGLAEFARVGMDIEQLPAQLQSGVVEFSPQLGPYNHIAWGILENGNLAAVVTSGLLNGSVSGRSGVRIDELAEVMKRLGFELAFFGSQGRDPLEAIYNGQFVAKEWYPNFDLIEGKMGKKEATTPGIGVILP